MLVLLTVIAVLVAMLVALQAVKLEQSVRAARRPAIDSYVGRRLVLHTCNDGPSIRGVLLPPYRGELRLADAEYLSDKGATPLDGSEQVIPRERMQFFQVLDAGEVE